MMKVYQSGDHLHLQNSDHLGMKLVTTPLTDKNFNSWSQSVVIVLGAKWKLGFVDGSCEKSSGAFEDLEQWKCVDCIVTSWSLNSMAKEILEAFPYVSSSAQLWTEIKERYEEANGPWFINLEEKLAKYLKVAWLWLNIILWDELQFFMPFQSIDHDLMLLGNSLR